jgi:hypothetical protein
MQVPLVEMLASDHRDELLGQAHQDEFVHRARKERPGGARSRRQISALIARVLVRPLYAFRLSFLNGLGVPADDAASLSCRGLVDAVDQPASIGLTHP